MTAGKTGTILVLVLGSGGLLFAGEKARSRDGGSSSRSSSAGERHHSSGTKSSGARSSSSSEVTRSSSSSDSSSDRSEAAPPLTDAQRRHPRAGTGHGYRHGRYYRGGYYGGYYGYGWPYSYYGYNPYRYGWYDHYWYSGYSPWYDSGYYGYGYPRTYYGRRYSYRMGQVRVQVEPSKTRVYVDGYYAGVADDFDGLFQRLNLPTGRHEIMLKLEGYRTHKIKIYVPLDQTVKIKLDMTKGLGEDVADWVGPNAPPEDEERYGEPRSARDDDYAEVEDDELDDDNGAPAGNRGTLRLEVTPSDASIYLNGQFRGTGRLETLSLPAGRYHLEIVRPGYRLLERDVEVEVGRTTRIVAALDHRS